MIKKRESEKRYKNVSSITQILLLIAVIFILFYAGVFKKSCTDDQCFNDYVRQCRPVDYFNQKNNNLYVYSVSRSLGESCNIKITLEKVAPGSDADVRELLEGESMDCLFPREVLETSDLNEIGNILSFCHGTLKEGIYELIIQRMYTHIIGNLNEIKVQTEGVLEDL